MRYKGHNIPDTEIDKMMDKLDISLKEACEIILSDRDNCLGIKASFLIRQMMK